VSANLNDIGPLSVHKGEQPTATVVVPAEHLGSVVHALLFELETFTVEPSPKYPGEAWHLGVFDSGVAVAEAAAARSVDLTRRSTDRSRQRA
jgi:hypothetical protein